MGNYKPLANYKDNLNLPPITPTLKFIDLQLLGGGGGPSGGHFNIKDHKMPDKGKPNSSITRYDKNGLKRETRYFDINGDKKKDIHYIGPPKHNYPHEHYWIKDNNGWHRTTYADWLKRSRK